MLYNDFQISAKDLQDCLEYFDLKLNYTLVDLETSKYLLLNSKKDDKEKILNVYDILYKLKIRDLSRKNDRPEMDLYKVNYNYAFRRKYQEFPSKFRNANDLNASVEDVQKLVDEHPYNIDKSATLEEISMVNNAFFNNYGDYSSKSILEYAKALNVRNNNRGEDIVNDVAISTASDDSIVKYSLKDMFEKFNDKILKGFSSNSYKKIMLNQLKGYFDDIENYYNNPNYINILQAYKTDINSFIDIKYEEYANKINKYVVKDENQAARYIQDDLNSLQIDVKDFSNKIFKKVYKDTLNYLDEKIASRKDTDDVLRLFSLRGQLKDNKITNFDELSRVYEEINNVENKVKFAK